ncbi:hypothetical protein [Xanthobacter agilis]|uniref:LTXXQ motif family protein n=1 Tax=Xanthobacter agilis TaxID=47492 RepID=A0ABU0L9B8_XANAG|nr:hypothetical protein [Xanthobacter agilis]MDQ0503729.1 hypothetical protein [Xanthobacter agilis]
MTRRTVRILLLSGVAVCFVGAAAAQSSSGKTQDRLPVAPSATFDAPIRMAALDLPFRAPPAPGADGPQIAAIDAPAPPPPAGFRCPLGAGGPGGGPGDRRMGPPGRPMMGPPGPRPDPLGYARALAAAETAVGIRTDQLDAWRDVTDALQASAALRARGPGPGPDGRRGPGAPAPVRSTGNATPATAAEPAPLAPIEALAGDLQEQGRVGERLARGLATLKAKLTPEQLDRMARLGPALLPPPGGRLLPPPPPPPPGGAGPEDED